MAPKNKYTYAEMTDAALRVVRESGIDGLTAKALACELKTSTQPIFTAFGSMNAVKDEVYNAAVSIYESYIESGLKEKIPFYGVGMQYIRFAREEPQLYRLLFLTDKSDTFCADDATERLRKAVQPMLMSVYEITEGEADFYFRNLWLAVHSLSTLVVTGNCKYTDLQIGKILTGFSACIYKGIKEIPGLVSGDFDSDKLFSELKNSKTE